MSKLIKLTKDNEDNRSTKTIELMEDNQYNCVWKQQSSWTKAVLLETVADS